MMKIQKPNLIIGAVGNKSLHKHWLKNGKTFDTFLVSYERSYENESTYHKSASGFKYNLIHGLICENPWILNYSYIWLPDDDLMVSGCQIDKLFTMMKEYDLWIAQPSIMGWYGMETTLHQKGSIIRFTNWVEIMCPCFSGDALKICYKTFTENKTGWGIEGIWNILLDHPHEKMGIIDDIIVFHTRKVLTGDTYRNFENPLETAIKEATNVYNKWNIEEEYLKDKNFGQPFEGEFTHGVTYKQIKKPMEENTDRSDRFWPPNDSIKFMIENFKG